MEQSVNEDERKDDCGDKEEKDDEATTSKAVVNDPIQIAYNVNDLKAFEFNSADDVRQTMKGLIKDKTSQDTIEVENSPLLPHVDTEADLTINDKREEVAGEKVMIGNVGEIKKDHIILETRKLPIRKRPGRPAKSGPSKRYKKIKGTKVFYIGKLSNLVLAKKEFRYASSSDDLSVVS